MHKLIICLGLFCIFAISLYGIQKDEDIIINRFDIPESADNRQVFNSALDINLEQEYQLDALFKNDHSFDEKQPIGYFIHSASAASDTFDRQSYFFDVPFISQAPDGDWKNPMQADGCEEASILMAWHWALNKPLSKERAISEITAISKFEQKLDGEFRDRSIADTAALLRTYFGYARAEVKFDIKADDIIQTLARGDLVIAAVNGRLLGNPHYVPPGPKNHMLVVTGYDHEQDEFIVNDPGTQYGQGNRYSRKIFEVSLKDYPTGYQGDFLEMRPAIIAVSRM